MTDQTAMGFVHRSWILSSNGRGHWRRHARTIRELRYWGKTVLGEQLRPVTERTRVIVTIAPLTMRRRDPANWAPTAKAIVDGLTDAGIWPDDWKAWVEGPDCREARSLSADVTTRPEPLRRVQIFITLTAPETGDGLQ